MADFLWVVFWTKCRAQAVHGQDARTHLTTETPQRQQQLLVQHLLQRVDPGLRDGLQLWILYQTALLSLSLAVSIPRSALFLSPFYIRPGWLLHKAGRVLRCAVKGRNGAETYLANSWRPSSRRWEVALSFAPSDAMRKWRSLNKVTWSSVWGCVTCSSSRQRSFTLTPERYISTKHNHSFLLMYETFLKHLEVHLNCFTLKIGPVN